MLIVRSLRYSFVCLFVLAAPIWAQPRPMSTAKSQKGMVVSVSPPATKVGAEILAAGGNAVDAAIAVEFALAVTWPEAGNIGGGGFMMVHPKDGEEVVCIDYREVAPLNATEKMFKPGDGRYTHKIVGVPGTVRGMELAHKRFGSLGWSKLVAPSVRLARDGFIVNGPLARSINSVVQAKSVKQGKHQQELVRVYGRSDGRPWRAGDKMVLPDLAATLERIANEGARGFYEGKTAELLAAEMKRGDGWIGLADLKQYQAKVRKAIHGRYRGFDVYGPPPPSSGGVCLVQMLEMLEDHKLREHKRLSARNLHLLAECMRRSFCERAKYLGDADFVEIPGRLTTPEYARKLAASIRPNQATPSESLAPEIKITSEPPSTTHFSVVDSNQMAVSNTTTLEGSWGARIVVKGAGFVLNNEMGDFNWFPGHTDRRGRIGTKPNRVAPQKRMLSSQTPTIVAKDGKPHLVTGSPGGRTIINTSLQMVLNVIEFDMSLPAAMVTPRIHHQWLPDQLSFETFDRTIGDDVIKELKSKGHRLAPRSQRSYQGDAHSILIHRHDDGRIEFEGVADWRRDGAAMGPK